MYVWILVVGSFASFYNAWGIGANDCANSFATSVGAKVLTLKKAIIIASIFEFLGAFLMGSHVTSAIRKKIVSIDKKYFRPNDVNYLLGNPKKANKEIKWKSKTSFKKLVSIMTEYDYNYYKSKN